MDTYLLAAKAVLEHCYMDDLMNELMPSAPTVDEHRGSWLNEATKLVSTFESEYLTMLMWLLTSKKKTELLR